MKMPNGHVCCILGVCCPARSDEQRKALSEEMVNDLGCNQNEARKFADWVIDNFDLAPVGSLDAYRDAIVKFAKKA